eukprot:2637059-Pleurochrysis_carterae.AAC.1
MIPEQSANCPNGSTHYLASATSQYIIELTSNLTAANGQSANGKANSWRTGDGSATIISLA